MVRRMIKKIEPGLFARLIQMAEPARKDLLEYIGQGPVSVEHAVGTATTADRAGPDTDPLRRRPPRR